MKAFRTQVYTRLLAVAFVLCAFSGVSAQNSEDTTVKRLPFQKNHFGVTASYTFSVQNIDQPRRTIMAYATGTHSRPMNPYIERYLNGYRTEHDEYGIGAFYTWHPLMKKDKVAWYDGLFLKFDVAGQYTNDHSDISNTTDKNYFMFNVGVSAGYTFTFNKVGLDIFTGLIGRFATKNRTHVKDGHFYAVVDGEALFTTEEYSCFPGGLTWRSGIGVNYSHFGVYLTFNDPLGYFIREHKKEYVKDELVNESTSSLKDRNSMSVGLIYRF